MKKINFKWFFWAGVDRMWPGEGIRVWIVPNETKEGTLEELFGAVDGSDYEPLAGTVHNSHLLLSSCDNVFDIL